MSLTVCLPLNNCAVEGKGVGDFERKVQTEGGVVHQPLLVSDNYSLSCGIKISTVHCFCHKARV